MKLTKLSMEMIVNILLFLLLLPYNCTLSGRPGGYSDDDFINKNKIKINQFSILYGSTIASSFGPAETQGYVDEDPSESAAPRLETFVHPDEAATQAYGDPGLDSESELESSQEVDFGLPIGQRGKS